MISSSPVALNDIYMTMSPRCVCPERTASLSSRLIASCPLCTSSGCQMGTAEDLAQRPLLMSALPPLPCHPISAAQAKTWEPGSIPHSPFLPTSGLKLVVSPGLLHRTTSHHFQSWHLFSAPSAYPDNGSSLRIDRIPTLPPKSFFLHQPMFFSKQSSGCLHTSFGYFLSIHCSSATVPFFLSPKHTELIPATGLWHWLSRLLFTCLAVSHLSRQPRCHCLRETFPDHPG